MNKSVTSTNPKKVLKNNSRIWWNSRRLRYNKGLFISGLLAFIVYAIVGNNFIAPYDAAFEITFFSTTLQIVGYLFLMLLANIFYELGTFVDVHLNKGKEEKFRKNLYKTGFWFSVILPFIAPLKLLITYLTQYS